MAYKVLEDVFIEYECFILAGLGSVEFVIQTLSPFFYVNIIVALKGQPYFEIRCLG